MSGGRGSTLQNAPQKIPLNSSSGQFSFTKVYQTEEQPYMSHTPDFFSEPPSRGQAVLTPVNASYHRRITLSV